MNGLLPPSADLIAELNRMHSLLDQVFPAAASSIRSAGAGAFPTLNVGTTPTSIEVMALAVRIERIAGASRYSPPQRERAAVHSVEVVSRQAIIVC